MLLDFFERLVRTKKHGNAMLVGRRELQTVLKRSDDGDAIGITMAARDTWPPTIEAVADDSVAALFGCRAGDQILELHVRELGGAIRVRDHDHAQSVLDDLSPGTMAMVTLLRRDAAASPSESVQTSRLDRARAARSIVPGPTVLAC